MLFSDFINTGGKNMGILNMTKHSLHPNITSRLTSDLTFNFHICLSYKLTVKRVRYL